MWLKGKQSNKKCNMFEQEVPSSLDKISFGVVSKYLKYLLKLTQID